MGSALSPCRLLHGDSHRLLATRKAFLVKEKQLRRLRDKLNAERRPLPMVRIEKAYVFEGPNGKETLTGRSYSKVTPPSELSHKNTRAGA